MAMQNHTDSVYCTDIGNDSAFDCCYASSQNSSICRGIFNADPPWYNDVCDPDCVGAKRCSDPKFIYGSKIQVTGINGTGVRPIHRYLACANIPTLAGYRNQGLLDSSILSQVADHIPQTTSSDALRNITFAVTDCLTATCRNARAPGRCNVACSGVNLLINSTTPNVVGLNECLNTLCTGNQNSLPYADADIVGIGVFASYIMQCSFVVILWFVFSGVKINEFLYSRSTSSKEHLGKSEEATGSRASSEVKSTYQGRFEAFLEEFHMAQCYFSITIQIAALTYGIFGGVDMLVTFMLVPLATNGVLPVVFTLVLLYKRNEPLGVNVILLTTVCWLLATMVYWTLYSHFIPINNDLISQQQENGAYRQFYYKLTALDACGGYSALAACPDNFNLARTDIKRESHKIRILTPIIWSFSTICLIAILVARVFNVRLSGIRDKILGEKKGSQPTPNKMEANSDAQSGTKSSTALQGQQAAQPATAQSPKSRPLFSIHNFVYVLVTMCFLAGIGMQLSLLSIFTSLDMMDRKDWSFGQVVAIMVWIPPLLAYLYKELKLVVNGF